MFETWPVPPDFVCCAGLGGIRPYLAEGARRDVEHQEHAQRLFSTFFIILTYPHFLGVNSFSSFYEIDDI